MKRFFKGLLCLAIVLVLVAGVYVAYVFLSFYRIEDNQALEVIDRTDSVAHVNTPYTLMTWNLGFGAYSADYSFFMDGGTESRARSEAAVYENILGAIETIRRVDPDFACLQEIDFDSTRSHQVDERALVYTAFNQCDAVFAQNYDSPYLFYPFTSPHGANKAGIITLSSANIASAIRRSLPIENGFTKVLDLDRCYSISRVPLDDGRELALFNLHLSAYTSDGTIANEQLKMLCADMLAEAETGNYAIAGGDFNKDLSGDAGSIYGVSGEKYTWAQPIPEGTIPDALNLVFALDETHPIPSCRNCDTGYIPGETFVLTVDGFLTTQNVRVDSAEVLDEGFRFTDHNPVVMHFTLLGETQASESAK